MEREETDFERSLRVFKEQREGDMRGFLISMGIVSLAILGVIIIFVTG